MDCMALDCDGVLHYSVRNQLLSGCVDIKAPSPNTASEFQNVKISNPGSPSLLLLNPPITPKKPHVGGILG